MNNKMMMMMMKMTTTMMMIIIIIIIIIITILIILPTWPTVQLTVHITVRFWCHIFNRARVVLSVQLFAISLTVLWSNSSGARFPALSISALGQTQPLLHSVKEPYLEGKAAGAWELFLIPMQRWCQESVQQYF